MILHDVSHETIDQRLEAHPTRPFAKAGRAGSSSRRPVWGCSPVPLPKSVNLTFANFTSRRANAAPLAGPVLVAFASLPNSPRGRVCQHRTRSRPEAATQSGLLDARFKSLDDTSRSPQGSSGDPGVQRPTARVDLAELTNLVSISFNSDNEDATVRTGTVSS